jgi:hypothetical protein
MAIIMAWRGQNEANTNVVMWRGEMAKLLAIMIMIYSMLIIMVMLNIIEMVTVANTIIM